MIIKNHVIERDAAHRPEGFIEAMRAAGKEARSGVDLHVHDMIKVYNAFPENKPRGLGDVVEKIAHPIAKAMGLPCIDKETDSLKPESPCAKRRDWLNKNFPM